MATHEIFCSAAHCWRKAGANVSSGVSSAGVIRWIDQAQSYINTAARYDFVTNYSSLKAEAKEVLAEAAENLTAIYMIMYDMSGYTSRIEAEDMINVLWARLQSCLKILKDQESVTYL